MAELAPLVTTPDAPAPPGGEAEWFQGARGARLRAALFRPEGRARGSVVLSGGRTEPIEKYYEVIGDFLSRGFVVLAHDWRGQGLSARELPDRHKGHARGYKDFLDDYQALLAAFESRLPKPWVAVGHSMGGGLTLLALAHGERRFAGALLSAPMLGVKTGEIPRRAARFAAGLNCRLGRAARYVPGQPRDPFAQDFETNLLTHDRARFARSQGLLAAEPQLALGAPTWGWLDFAFRAAAYLAKPDRLRGITIPVTILQAEDDRLVDNAAQEAAARHLPQGKLVKAPGAYHEILMETDPMRNIFLKVFDALTGRAAPKPAEAPKAAPPTPPTAAAAPPAATVATPAPATAAAKPAPAKKPAAKKAPVKPAAAKAAPKAGAAATKKPAAKKVPAKKASAKPAAVKPAAKPKSAPAKAKTPAKAAAKKPAPKAAAAKAAPKAKPAPAKAAASKAHAPKTSAPKAKPAARKAPARKKAEPAA